MKYIFVDDLRSLNIHKDTVYFKRDLWDDYGWGTYFNIYLNRNYIGDIRIAKIEKHEGVQRTWDALIKDGLVNRRLSSDLPEEYFSLAREETYNNLYKNLSQQVVNEFLSEIRDIAFNLSYLDEVENTFIYDNSLIRGINTTYVKKSLHDISHNSKKRERAFDLIYEQKQWIMKISSNSSSILPSNLYAIIGDNGIGKTRLLRDLVAAALNPATYKKSYYFNNEKTEFTIKNRKEISSAIYISLSPFDNPDEDFRKLFCLSDKKKQEYSKIRNIAILLDRKSNELINQILSISKSSKDADPFGDLVRTKEKKDNLEIIINEFKWDDNLNVFFEEVNNLQPDMLSDKKSYIKKVENLRTRLFNFSSGQKYIVIILLAIVENIIEKSMLVIDEPEDFLHPPYVAALVNAISRILRKVRGIGIMATHSDVVLQELPKKCVYCLSKDKEIKNPDIQTFAADVSLINKEVFGLELSNTGYYKILEDLAKNRREEAEKLLMTTNEELGESGRFYLTLLLNEGD